MCMYTIVSFSEGKNYRLLPIVAGIRQRIQRAVRDTSPKVKVKVQRRAKGTILELMDNLVLKMSNSTVKCHNVP